MDRVRIIAALKEFAGSVPTTVPWIVVAGANLVLSGLRQETNDIDIITTSDGYRTLSTLFVDRTTVPTQTKPTGFTSFHLKLAGAEFEIGTDAGAVNYTSDLENGLTVSHDLAGTTVHGLRLEREAVQYENMGRTAKARSVRDWLATHPPTDETAA